MEHLTPKAIALRKQEILRHPELVHIMEKDPNAVGVINALMEVLAGDTESRSYKIGLES